MPRFAKPLTSIGYTQILRIVRPIALLGVGIVAIVGFSGGVSAFDDRWDVLIVQHSNKCMDVTGGSTSTGALIIQYTCHGGDNQSVQIVDVGAGWHQIKFKHSGKCLDGGQDLQLEQMPCTSSNYQRWSLADTGSIDRLKNQGDAKCADVVGADTEDLAAVIRWSCHSGTNQQWQTRDTYDVGLAPATGYWSMYDSDPDPSNPDPDIHHLVSCEPTDPGTYDYYITSGYCNAGAYPNGPGGDWSTDYYAVDGTAIRFNALGVGTPGANITARVWAITSTCSSVGPTVGGWTVFVDVYTNGYWEGWYAFGHLNNIAVQPGQWISSGTVLGYTKWWNASGCYQVSTASGVHTHIEMYNANYEGFSDGYACYIRYSLHQYMNSSFPLGYVGRTIYDSLRDRC